MFVRTSICINDIKNAVFCEQPESETQAQQIAFIVRGLVLEIAVIYNRMDVNRWRQDIAVFCQNGSERIGLQTVLVKTPNGVDSAKTVQFVCDVCVTAQVKILAFDVKTVLSVQVNVVAQLGIHKKLPVGL